MRIFLSAVALTVLLAATATAATLAGQVLGGGMPIAKSAVTLYAAGQGEPRKLTQATAMPGTLHPQT